MTKNITIKKSSQADRVLSEYLKSFIKTAANEVKFESKAICPVDTGRLKKSITVVEVSEEEYLIGSPVNYSKYVEYGTRFQSAQAFLRRALYTVIRKKL